MKNQKAFHKEIYRELYETGAGYSHSLMSSLKLEFVESIYKMAKDILKVIENGETNFNSAVSKACAIEFFSGNNKIKSLLCYVANYETYVYSALFENEEKVRQFITFYRGLRDLQRLDEVKRAISHSGHDTLNGKKNRLE